MKINLIFGTAAVNFGIVVEGLGTVVGQSLSPVFDAPKNHFSSLVEALLDQTPSWHTLL